MQQHAACVAEIVRTWWNEWDIRDVAETHIKHEVSEYTYNHKETCRCCICNTDPISVWRRKNEEVWEQNIYEYESISQGTVTDIRDFSLSYTAQKNPALKFSIGYYTNCNKRRVRKTTVWWLLALAWVSRYILWLLVHWLGYLVWWSDSWHWLW